ncbi:MAG: hypothetical protein JKY96_02895 [Phycisphaerales bacterium]|nr:hypothetical protein [Phycisphaerales bacterium]
MLRIFILVVILLTPHAKAAEPPELACLSGLSLDEVFAQNKHINGGFIIIVGDKWMESDTWASSVWNDPEVVEYLKSHHVLVTYMDQESDPAFFDTLDIGATPTFIYYSNRRVRSRRIGLVSARDESREATIEWVRAARSNLTLLEKRYKKVHEDPTNIASRVELMKELSAEGQAGASTEQHCWVIDHNQLWYEYMIQQDELKTEDEFQFMLYWFIMGARDNLVLIRRTDFSGHESDGWKDAIRSVEYAESNPWTTPRSPQTFQSKKAYVDLRRALESRRDNNTATERDLFILNLLTAEGEEGQAIHEQFRKYFDELERGE